MVDRLVTSGLHDVLDEHLLVKILVHGIFCLIHLSRFCLLSVFSLLFETLFVPIVIIKFNSPVSTCLFIDFFLLLDFLFKFIQSHFGLVMYHF